MTTSPKVAPDISLERMMHNSDILLLDNHNHWELYPTEEALSIASIERLPSGIGLRFEFTSAAGFKLDHLDVSSEGEAEVTTEANIIVVRFPVEECLEPQLHSLKISGVALDGNQTRTYHLGLNYVSNKRDAANGRTMFSRVIVKDTDLNVSYSHISDWIIETPTADDRSYAQNRWGALLSSEASPYSRARTITREVINDFEPHRGVPSDVMTGLHPFRQHERILAGIDHGWCANLSEVLCHALNSLDIPCRLVRMRNTYYNAEVGQPGRDFEVLLAGGHTITEIFDATLNQWIWIEPTLRQLGVRDAGGHYLNFAETHHRINLPHQARDLRLDAYDPATGEETTVAFADSPVRTNMLHYCKREQRFYYFKKPA